MTAQRYINPSMNEGLHILCIILLLLHVGLRSVLGPNTLTRRAECVDGCDIKSLEPGSAWHDGCTANVCDYLETFETIFIQRATANPLWL